jgi:AAA domain, putative AbiEii toxin, Type IV TA system
MKFTLENFRPFHKEIRVDIAPLTILVGENSSGKSSFLAGLRYIIESMSANTEGSFNREPFFLGAYDQIAHFRGGRYGRSAHFDLGLSLSKEELGSFATLRRSNSPNYVGKDQELTDFSAKLRFSSEQSQPLLDRVIFENGYVSILLSRQLLPNFDILTLSTGQTKTITQDDRQLLFFPLPPSLIRNSMAPFSFAVQDWVYSNFIERPSRKSKSPDNVADLTVKAALPINPFAEHSIYASAPFRTKPERTYSPIEASTSAEGSHIPFLLAQAKAFDRNRWTRIKTSLEDFGRQSGLFKKIDIKRLGNSTSDPFQIIISVSQDRSNVIDVGYGVSQILPIIVETLMNDESRFFVFQQPEVHLHPRAQAELGSYFVNYAIEGQKFLLLETHSDYIIDRIKSDLINKRMDLSRYLSILFFERHNLETKITRVLFDELGNVVSAPVKYREFFIAESLRTLGL